MTCPDCITRTINHIMPTFRKVVEMWYRQRLMNWMGFNGFHQELKPLTITNDTKQLVKTLATHSSCKPFLRLKYSQMEGEDSYIPNLGISFNVLNEEIWQTIRIKSKNVCKLRASSIHHVKAVSDQIFQQTDSQQLKWPLNNKSTCAVIQFWFTLHWSVFISTIEGFLLSLSPEFEKRNSLGSNTFIAHPLSIVFVCKKLVRDSWMKLSGKVSRCLFHFVFEIIQTIFFQIFER